MRKYTHTHTHTHTQRAPGADPIFSWRYVHVQIKRTGTTSKQTEFQPQRPEILRNRHHIVQVNPHSLVAHITKVSEPESPPPKKKTPCHHLRGGATLVYSRPVGSAKRTRTLPLQICLLSGRLAELLSLNHWHADLSAGRHSSNTPRGIKYEGPLDPPGSCPCTAAGLPLPPLHLSYLEVQPGPYLGTNGVQT